MNGTKELLKRHIEALAPRLTAMSDDIFDHPEVGLEEHRAAELLCTELERGGFEVERGIAGLPTAFRARWRTGTSGPVIGLLCEYDAIENMGHACAHHMQGPAMVGAALALREGLKDASCEVVVYGTPAEETVSGKSMMLKEGCFHELDVALMVHGGPTTTTDIQSLAMSRYRVRFHGKSAHAAIKPEDGRSALDAALLMFHGIEFLREHVKDDIRMHYTILNAGGPANVVAKETESLVYLRGYDRPYLDTVVRRFFDVANGAALMTGTTAEIIEDKVLHNKIPVLKLNDLVMEVAREMDAPTIRPPRAKTGSTDFGNVMFHVPGTCLRIAFVPEGSSAHSQEYLDAGKSDALHRALILSAQIIAEAVRRLVEEPDLMKDIQEEFGRKKRIGSND